MHNLYLLLRYKPRNYLGLTVMSLGSDYLEIKQEGNGRTYRSLEGCVGVV